MSSQEKYTAKYFTKTSRIAEAIFPKSVVTLQFFQRKDNVKLCGMNEVLQFLMDNTDTSKYKIKNLEEGTIIKNKDIVLELKGHYKEFGIYEGVIDGILARASSLATNAMRVVEAAKGKTIIFMGDRADHYINQERDGYAMAQGGITTQVTDAQVKLHAGTAIGTIPHAMIQMFEGDLVETLKAYKIVHKADKLVALVDFNNDVIGDSLKVLKAFKGELAAVRVDTSPDMSDLYFSGREKEYGVTPNLIKALRKELDANKGKHVKIIVSSGFNVDKITEFEKAKTPVDIYGVGASIMKVWINYSADAVKFNDKKIAKKGREYRKFK